MVKDIYIIKNDLNNQVYVGQAKNTKERFCGHCKPSSAINDNSLIDKAIAKYGKEHFWYEILETQIENYNEQEKYWIASYNCQYPNGYNLTAGGEEPPIMKGFEHPEAKLTEQQVNELTLKLQTTTFSLASLGRQYGMARTTICDFNKGKTYFREDIQYPIRKENPIGKLTEADIDEIINILKTSYRSFEDIGQEYEVEARAISRINRGIFHKRSSEEYPIREGQIGRWGVSLTFDDVTQIINLLQYSTLSLREIAKQTQSNLSDVMGIKNGTIKIYRRKGLTYPLRPNN